VVNARVDGGPYYRRWRPKDRGRAHPIAKRTSHILIELAEGA
ncbi:MAG: 50S ribosomal protein L22, partial [Planctomycetes bacterium]|nr:50S ribosomal protein L22 [Planctomycetota bacterium]